MNRFLKNNFRWLGLPGLALLIVLLAYVFRPESPGYQADVQNIPAIMNNPSKRVAVKDLAGKQLVDIRPAGLFAEGHPDNAINLPVRQLLDRESLDILDELAKSGRQAVLCGTDELQATAPWLLLQQLGYGNLLLLKGGAGMDGVLKETAVPQAETAVMDTSVFRSAIVPVVTSASSEATKKPVPVIPVRKEATSGGGC